MGATMLRDNPLRNTHCSRGHVHPPWNATGLLRIAKCETVCGFCQKETKTAANLRKHVAIHIKNEGMHLSVAEGSSGRGRLEMPLAELDQHHSLPRISHYRSDEDGLISSNPPSNLFSAPEVLMSMSSNPQVHGSSITPPESNSFTLSSGSFSQHSHPEVHSQYHYQPSTEKAPDALHMRHEKDPFWALREHNLSTKSAWTAIPAAEGFRILDLCKSLSSGDTSKAPCYNRKTLFDEEWQAHMRDIHGVYLLWPETWMRRIEILDLEPFGGDIGACNEVIMAS